ncbi:MAG: DHH family phosphoesterase [Candidatus Peribacteraceae bacterium]|nr:DHH family phosphoesterase [Candidatus Peribacteraceae bacterium]
MATLSLTGKEWTIREDFRGGNDLSGTLFRARALDTAGDAPLPFHAPGPTPPALPAALERIRHAVKTEERVGLFGDYDCDGITATAQLVRFFLRQGIRPFARLPHRQHEGYGLREETVRAFLEKGATLLITVDTGVVSHREIALAKAGGMDVIVVDHHHLPETLPDAVAVLHPGLVAADAGTHPAAAGLAFGLVAALEGGEWRDRDTDLALAATGTVADLVELTGVNRTLVREGVAAYGRLTEGPLRMLCANARIDGIPSSRDIAFRIAPRLNAAGRMDDPHIALRALLGDGHAVAQLEQLNQDRQQQTRALLAGITADLSRPFLTLASPDYPAGIIGLIAGRLTEAHGRPSLVAQIQGDVCVASLRSIPGFHVTEALQSCADLLLTFGGHAQAAGCTFATASFDDLRDRLNAHAARTLSVDTLRPVLPVDGLLDAAQVTLPLIESMRTLEPFGQGNPEPRFVLPGVRFSSLKRVGAAFAHIQGTVGPLKVIGFQLGTLFERIPVGPVDIACRLSVDTWNGNMRPQLLVEDVREAFISPATIEAVNVEQANLPLSSS